MEEIRCKFTESINRTDNVKSFRFALSGKFDYAAGQYVKVIFDKEDRSNKNLNKILSLSCRPGLDYIEVTKKMSESDFSKKLSSLNSGDEVLFSGPMGRCVLPEDSEKLCFLVGGIGITPVCSMLQDASENKSGHDIALIYSNWTRKDIAFDDELKSLVSANKNIQLIDVLMEEDVGDIPKGIITDQIISDKVQDYKDRLFYIFGPPKMIDAMKEVCNKLGITQDKIKFEAFVGY